MRANSKFCSTKKSIHDAVIFATKKHKGQVRKGSNLPYIVHPIAVLSKIGEWEIDDHIVRMAAVTHDVLEDCEVTSEDMVKVIGKQATEVVKELSFFPDLKSHVPVNVQKQKYMKSFMTSSIPALVIKIADRCCNTHDWAVAGDRYGKKYWKKADDLFSAFATRRDEVIEFFGGPEKINGKINLQRELGEIIYTKMQYTKTCINGMVQ